jgi:hypothetical protein
VALGAVCSRSDRWVGSVGDGRELSRHRLVGTTGLRLGDGVSGEIDGLACRTEGLGSEAFGEGSGTGENGCGPTREIAQL